MVLRCLPLLLLAFCAPLGAQKPVELAVGYPSTTLAYVEADATRITKAFGDPAMWRGLGVSAQLPDFGKEITERLDIELSDADVKKLVAGVQRASWGLLDIGIGRPRLKMEIVLRHEDPSVLARALERAAKNESESIRGVTEYEGAKIYEVELPVREEEVDPENWSPPNPMSGFLDLESLFIVVFGNRYIIASTGLNHVKDALDFMAFPDDATDTLFGNKRYKDALTEFDKPDGLLFINTTALINTLERVSGDKGNSPLNEFFGGVIRFTGELLEYKQLKSVAAGFWSDDATRTMKMDARIQFHNEPAIFSAIKLKPVPQPLAEFVPVDTVYGMTYGIENPRELYTRVMSLLRSRATESGQQDVLRELDRFEALTAEQGVKVEEILDQLAGAQALVVLPSANESGRYQPVETLGMFRLRDVKEAEKFFYERLLRTKAGKSLRDADVDITMMDDVEIHHAHGGRAGSRMAFAFVKDVFILGTLDGIKRVVTARKEGRTLDTMEVYRQARGMIWEKCGSTAYLNVGALIKLSGGMGRIYYEGMPAPQLVDATEEDENPTPYLSKFFSNTVMVWGSQARENELALRLCLAGVPTTAQFREMALHFRDVARNKQVRNQFMQVLDGATTHFALKGKAAKTIQELRDKNCIPRGLDLSDPFAEEGETRSYALAEVPDNLDIRQPVLLCHQVKPGLDGTHLAVLWNGYIVKLTPSELARAIERAKKGLALERYRTLAPLVSAKSREENGEPKVRTMSVEVIGDDGHEYSVEATENDVFDVESKLDEPPPEDDDTEPMEDADDGESK